MAPPFNPKRVIRKISRPMLKEFFERRGHNLDVDWTDTPSAVLDAIFEGWQHLPNITRKDIEVIFQDVHSMANEDGLVVLYEEGNRAGVDLAPLNSIQNRYEKALWMCMNQPEIWDRSLRFAEADSLAEGRSWIKRGSMPAVEPRTSAETRDTLREGLSAFYVDRQGRGHQCKVDHFLRGENTDYFFVYLSDYEGNFPCFDVDGKFDRIPQRRAFEVVFAYDRDESTLEMHAKGGRQIIEPLQAIFCRVILGEELPPEDPTAKAYNLDALIDSRFRFPTDPEDGVDGTSIRCLRLSILGRRRGRITLEPEPDDGPERIYEMLEQDLNRKRLPKSILKATKATINMKLNGNGCGRSLTFTITLPNSCDLKNRREEQRLLGEKCLRKWGIDVS